MKRSRLPTGTLVALLLPATVHAADRFWIDAVGGTFADVANWSATSGGAGGATVPGVADIANFTLNNPYTVAFVGAVTTAAIDLENGNVTFDLTGESLTSTGTFGIDVGDTAALTGRLTVRGGTLGVDSEGDDITLGVVPTSTGFLTVVANGRIGGGTIRPDVIVGSSGNGTLTVTDNGRVDGRNLDVGTATGAAGTLSINSAAAAMTMTGTADIGFSGAGALSIQNGGTLSVSGVSTLGENPGADGSTTVSGIGSAWAAAECNVGFGGKGALTVSGGGLVSVNNLNAGLSTSSSGVVTVTGPGSQLLGTGTQSFGVFGPGTLTISSGGRAEGSTTAILGTSSGSEGRATVSGAGSLWRVASSVFVGNSGAGTLTVSGGGEFQGGATTVGTGAAGVGVLTVTGAGSVATIGGSLLVGSLGSGTLNVESGAEVTSGNLTINDPAGAPIGTLNLGGGSLFVGGDFVRSGVLNFPDGLLRVAGDFQANPGVAPFTLNGSTVGDLPLLDLVGSATTTNISTLIIGSNRRGELRLREGRALSVGAISIGLNAGGSGNVKVESGASLSTTGTLAVGGNGATPGGTGTLTIAGGSVDIGALRLHSGGTIHLESGLFAVDSLPALNGAFTWTAGEVRLDAASTQLDDFLASKLLGPAKTLRPGQTLGTPLLGGQVVEIFTGLTVDGGTISPAALSNFGTLDFRSGSVGGLITTTNNGLVQLGGPLARFGAGGGITNSGTIRGSGQLSGSFTNAASGRVEIIAGERLILNTGAASVNAGTMSVIGGELQVNDVLTNAAGTGLISARDALLFFSGVVNNGAFTFSNGTVDVFGDITQNAGGRITVSNGGIASFYDDVVIQPGAASVHATALGSIVSRVVFFGSYNGGLTGGGQAFIEGDHRPGHSPALITFGGGVAYGTFANLEMELGGTARGTQHDALNVTRDLTFGGTLTVTLTGGFLPQAGQAFDLFDFDAALDAGSFDTITLPSLSAGLAWDTSALYTTGTLGVIALTPIEQWRLLYFDSPANSGDGSDDNDFDKDGASNLIEYALGLNPRIPSAAGLPQLGIVTAGASQHAALTLTRPLSATDINYRFEVTADLASYDAGSFYGTGGDVPTNAFTTQVTRTNDGTTETITVRDNIPLTGAARRFLRLKVTNPLP